MRMYDLDPFPIKLYLFNEEILPRYMFLLLKETV